MCRCVDVFVMPLSFLPNRLWCHYSTINSETVFYKEFLERLGVDCENHYKITPESIRQGNMLLLYVT